MGGKFEEAVWGMRRGLASLDDAHALLQHAAAAFDASIQHLGEVAPASNNPSVQAAMTKLGAVLEALREAHGQAEGFAETFDSYLAQIGADGVGAAPAEPPEPPPPAPAIRKKPLNPRRPNPAGFDGLTPYEDAGTAEANLHFEDGQWNDEPMRAADRGPGTHAADLKEPWATDPLLKTRFHIEGHAAAIMRQRGDKTGVLYLNTMPCGKESGDPKRCDFNLAAILRKGQTLWVHVRLKSGTTRIIPYIGTGEGVKDG